MSRSARHSVVLRREGPLALLALGEPADKIAVLTTERMKSLDDALGEVEADKDLKGLVIYGASIHGFCAGADLEAIRGVTDTSVGTALAKEGQRIFARIEKLPLVTVALIRGACVGGGCELVLACRHRVLVEAAETKIGLPEVKLGILPGFGGTQRLPRLIGLPAAFDIILKGKTVSASEAKKIGLADLVLKDPEGSQPAEAFEAHLKTASDIAGGKRPLSRAGMRLGDKLLTNTGIGRSIVRKKASAAVKKDTKGFYPAPLKAIDVTLAGLEKGTAHGYEVEAAALGELVATPECKSLVHLFLVSEAAGKLGKAAQNEVKGTGVAVIGAGVMGAGIASSFLVRGFPVFLLDTFPEALEKGKAHVESFVRKRRHTSPAEIEAMLARLTVSADLDVLKPVSLVIEAVVEDVEIKRQVFREVLKRVGKEAIVASNTSSLSLEKIFTGLAQPERFLGVHFFNPAEKMPLVELVRTGKSGETAILRAAAYTGQIGKYPIVVEDVPGFLVNRILTPYLSEAAHLLADGVDAKDIDKAALAFGMPMGPVRLLDEIGLDVASKVASVIQGGYGERMEAPDFAGKLLGAGRKGKKSGSGFYLYSEEGERLDPNLRTLLGVPPQPDSSFVANDITDRLILPMLNEAVRCHDEGVAGRPGADAAAQIDLGSVMGLGFAPFRGGIIHYAESRGAKKLMIRMFDLSNRYGKRFLACEGIVKRAENHPGEGKSFYEALASL